MGAPPYWQANVEVADVDATRREGEAARRQGLHVEDRARPSAASRVIADPQGAVIAVFTPASDMARTTSRRHGEFSWHELYTTDHEAAFAFYSAIVGWEQLGEFDMGPMGKYLLWGRDGKQLGGMMTKPNEGPTKPLPRLAVLRHDRPTLDAALERAKAKGATVLNGPMEVPGGQRIVQLMDPHGAAFALVTPPPAA